MTFKVGIDVGGTFTDFLVMDAGGQTHAHKELSTPTDPSLAVMAGLQALAATHSMTLPQFISDIGIIVHGTTVTTNAVLTGNAARTGLLTTRGFRDALQMRRGVREVMYDNRYHPPAPIVPRELRLPVTERMRADGQVVTAIDSDDLEEAIATLRAARVEAVAICFLHAHANPAHEAEAARVVREALADTYVSVSSEVIPQIRFYERTSTTVLNAGVGPILQRYLRNLTTRLEDARYRGVLLIMQSNGGVASPASVSRLAAMTLLSGPAAAPAAGLACMAATAQTSFITVDMGGTSFDATLVRDGEPLVTTDGTVNHYALALPSMDIKTIGAGGGSIAWIDDGGLLRVGPQSAGAAPGPACYAQGGSEPTCTDANLVLGFLSPGFFAGGRITLDAEAAERAIRTRIADPLKMTVVNAAFGIYQVINVNMASAIREISVQRGYDPRDFPLLCAGGAGPIHGAAIAAELGIRRIVVPRDSSIFCASGMLRTDLKRDYVRSLARPVPDGHGADERIGALVAELEDLARATLEAEGFDRAQQRLRFSLDLRYQGQYHEVNVPVPIGLLLEGDWAGIRQRFHERHDQMYGYALAEDGTTVEILNLRLAATGLTVKPEIARQPRSLPDPAAAARGSRRVFLPEKRAFATVPVYDGDRLAHGHQIEGPAIIESVNTTIVVPLGYRADYDEQGNCLLGAT